MIDYFGYCYKLFLLLQAYLYLSFHKELLGEKNISAGKWNLQESIVLENSDKKWKFYMLHLGLKNNKQIKNYWNVCVKTNVTKEISDWLLCSWNLMF